MKEIVLAVWLGIAGVVDWKYKVIPLWLSIPGGIIGIGFCVIESRSMENIVVSCLFGMAALLISKLTNEVIGYGDGIVFLIMGLFLSWDRLTFIGILAFIIAGMVALVLLVVFRKNGRCRMPFLPFLAMSYYISLWTN